MMNFYLNKHTIGTFKKYKNHEYPNSTNIYKPTSSINIQFGVVFTWLESL